MVARRIGADGWRMTGSALTSYELRGTFHVILLRALSGIEGESEGRGWRD